MLCTKFVPASVAEVLDFTSIVYFLNRLTHKPAVLFLT